MVVWLRRQAELSRPVPASPAGYHLRRMTGLPSASFLKSWPGRKHFDVLQQRLGQRAHGVAARRDCRDQTSTRMPGTTNPATPTTSFTRTATARMPCGIVAAKPPPGALGGQARLDHRLLGVDRGDDAAPHQSCGLTSRPRGPRRANPSASRLLPSARCPPPDRARPARLAPSARPALAAGARLISDR